MLEIWIGANLNPPIFIKILFYISTLSAVNKVSPCFNSSMLKMSSSFAQSDVNVMIAYHPKVSPSQAHDRGVWDLDDGNGNFSLQLLHNGSL